MSRVDHLSYSAIVTFLNNQVEFQKRYIAKIYDNPKTPSLVVGTSFHKAMETFYDKDGGNIQAAIEAGLEEMSYVSDSEIDFGKTGSREKMMQDYTRLVNKYFEEAPQYDEVVDVEKRLEASIANVPMVGVIDMVVRDNGLRLIDYKTVTAYSPDDEESYKYLMQAYIYLVLAEAEYNQQVTEVVFKEIKKTINRDGSPQCRDVAFDRQSVLAFAPIAKKIITNVYEYVNDDRSKFFPNMNDRLNGANSMDIIANQQEGFDAAKIKRQVRVADNFEQQNVVIDDGTGTDEEKILRKLIEFGIGGKMGETYIGPQVIKYTMQPNRGVSMKRIADKASDLAIALESESVRIEAPIAGTNLVGIEIPNKERKVVPLTDEHLQPGTFKFPLGMDAFGKVHYCDIVKTPHLLIAGQTGAGKSVMINVILDCITKQLTPEQMKLVLIDPKEVELAMYEGDEHLDGDIITNPKDASEKFHWLVEEMGRRYKELRKRRVRDIADYEGKMPRIVVVVDEFADLMMTSKKNPLSNIDYDMLKEAILDEATLTGGKLTKAALKSAVKRVNDNTPPSAEESIIRLAQKARAVGIHLILATQRPSADVVTGLIKANIPTKISFSVTNSLNSKIILDEVGAESLTGKGDLLYSDPTAKSLQRLQGLYI